MFPLLFSDPFARGIGERRSADDRAAHSGQPVTARPETRIPGRFRPRQVG